MSGSWSVPRTAVSGVYLARLVRLDTPRPSWRADGSRYPADSRFAFPDDESGELPKPPGGSEYVVTSLIRENSLFCYTYKTDGKMLLCSVNFLAFPDDKPGQLPAPPGFTDIFDFDIIMLLRAMAARVWSARSGHA